MFIYDLRMLLIYYYFYICFMFYSVYILGLFYYCNRPYLMFIHMCLLDRLFVEDYKMKDIIFFSVVCFQLCVLGLKINRLGNPGRLIMFYSGRNDIYKSPDISQASHQLS